MKRLIKTLLLFVAILPFALQAQEAKLDATKITNLKQITKANASLTVLSPILFETLRDTLPKDWWRSKSERGNVEGEGSKEEPFQKDIFEGEDAKDNYVSSRRNRGFNSSRGVPTRANKKTTRGRRGNKPDEFTQKSPRRILAETEVPVGEYIKQREVQVLPNNYKGYMIEILSSPEELSQDHEIFYRHGNIVLYNSAGTYTYLLGKFTELEDAERFLEDTMSERYPEAQVVEFEFGQRVN